MRSTHDTPRPRVAIVNERMPVYRVAFHEQLKVALDRRGIDVTLIHGKPYGDFLTRGDGSTVSFATACEHRVLRVAGRTVTWLPSYRLTRDADLVICDQHAARLSNHALWLRSLASRQKFALWGHGKNFQTDSSSPLGESVKRFISRRVDWWFAYNDLSAAVVASIGYPADRITSVQNAIDTRGLSRTVTMTPPVQVGAVRDRLGIVGDNVGLFIGSMYAEKRMPYLIDACDHVRAQVADFEVLFVGAGPERPVVAQAAASRPWMHDVGAAFGNDKAPYLRMAKVLLLPGLVGLTILDGLAAGIPLITVADSHHSPEIDYLDDGRNGRLLPAGTDAAGYAAAVVDLLHDDATRKDMAEACRRDSERYTIEAMVDRFATGIQQALAAPPR